jgi:hypothetical protein
LFMTSSLVVDVKMFRGCRARLLMAAGSSSPVWTNRPAAATSGHWTAAAQGEKKFRLAPLLVFSNHRPGDEAGAPGLGYTAFADFAACRQTGNRAEAARKMSEVLDAPTTQATEP